MALQADRAHDVESPRVPSHDLGWLVFRACKSQTTSDDKIPELGRRSFSSLAIVRVERRFKAARTLSPVLPSWPPMCWQTMKIYPCCSIPFALVLLLLSLFCALSSSPASRRQAPPPPVWLPFFSRVSHATVGIRGFGGLISLVCFGGALASVTTCKAMEFVRISAAIAVRGCYSWATLLVKSKSAVFWTQTRIRMLSPR